MLIADLVLTADLVIELEVGAAAGSVLLATGLVIELAARRFRSSKTMATTGSTRQGQLRASDGRRGRRSTPAQFRSGCLNDAGL
ncbi:MAG TPA: hypothetical protein VF469_14735 [Kofleriaceae bacterium]